MPASPFLCMPLHTRMSDSIFMQYGSAHHSRKFLVGFKREDIRKDWIIQGIVSYMHRCLKNDGIDVPNTSYRVLPTSTCAGLVQWVPNCKTLAALKETGKAIQSYITENNKHVPSGVLQQTFMRSLAASTVFTFLLVRAAAGMSC